MSRPLPNVFALAVVIIGFAHWIKGNAGTAVAFLSTGTQTPLSLYLSPLLSYHVLSYLLLLSSLLVCTTVVLLCYPSISHLLFSPALSSHISCPLSTAVIIFRCDIAILCFTIGLSMLYHKRLSVTNGIMIGVGTVVLASGLSFLVDSYFWKRNLVPEIEVFYFNTVLNKSNEWYVMNVYIQHLYI